MSTGRLIPVYRRRSSPLHAARAGAAAGLCASLALVGLLFEHPLVLGAALVALLGAGAAAGVGAQMRGAARVGLVLAAAFALVNPLVAEQGATILVRGWTVLGHGLDIELEALVYGAVAGLRVLVMILAFALYSAVVDPDEALRLVRRFGYRSALTASLATRLVPVLARDASRMGEAARCRPAAPGRTAVARAAVNGALERAVGVAAALEVRGYGTASRPARERRPWSRHDRRAALSAAVLAVGVAVGFAFGVGEFSAYPTLELAAGPGEALLCAGVLTAAALPFAGAGARMGVARA